MIVIWMAWRIVTSPALDDCRNEVWGAQATHTETGAFARASGDTQESAIRNVKNWIWQYHGLDGVLRDDS